MGRPGSRVREASARKQTTMATATRAIALAPTRASTRAFPDSTHLPPDAHESRASAASVASSPAAATRPRHEVAKRTLDIWRLKNRSVVIGTNGRPNANQGQYGGA